MFIKLKTYNSQKQIHTLRLSCSIDKVIISFDTVLTDETKLKLGKRRF